jgi:hypothetical protein
MLWDMIRYENYDETSPYNREAANWVKNQIHFRLPLDQRPLRDRKAGYADPLAADLVADKPKPKAKKEESRWRGSPSQASTPVARQSTPPPVRTPAPQPAQPIEAEVIFLDDGPSLPRPAVVPAASREEGGIVFIE